MEGETPNEDLSPRMDEVKPPEKKAEEYSLEELLAMCSENSRTRILSFMQESRTRKTRGPVSEITRINWVLSCEVQLFEGVEIYDRPFVTQVKWDKKERIIQLLYEQLSQEDPITYPKEFDVDSAFDMICHIQNHGCACRPEQYSCGCRC